MENYHVANSYFIRDLNLIGIFKLIHKYGPISRKELADNTGYSGATISNHVKRLLHDEFVIEVDKGSSTGGRKPVYLSANPDKGYIISVEIKIDQVVIVIFDLKLSVKDKRILPIIKKNKPDETLRKVVGEINLILADNGLAPGDILGMGLAVPGLVDRDNNILDFAPNLGWKKIDIMGYFSENYSFPMILENEANASAIGEREFVYPDVDNMVYVSINEGIGCGIIFNGRLYRGSSGNAGEFGHIIIDSDGPKCHCGNHGCWETMASESFIITSFSKLLDFPLTKEDIFNLNMGLDQEELDQEKLKIFKETGKNIGIGLVNIINSLSPALVVIGGGIIVIKDIIKEDIDKVLRERALAISYERVDVKYSRLGDQATVYGLAKLVFEKIIEREIGEVN